MELEFFGENVYQKGKDILFIDIGCGPMTSCLALADYYQQNAPDNRLNIKYFGIDIEKAVTDLAERFSQSTDLFGNDFSAGFSLTPNFPQSENFQNKISCNGTLIFNFSYIFGQPNAQNYVDEWINFVIDTAQACQVENVYTIYLNKDATGYAGAYDTFKRKTRLNAGSVEKVSHNYRRMCRQIGRRDWKFDFTPNLFTSESLHYEIGSLDWKSLCKL